MNEILVHPGQLVCVHVRRPDGGEDRYRCISCRYIQIPGPAIGVQLIYDPANQAPGNLYYIPEVDLQWAIVEPDQLVRIHPYGHP